jgi:hypothetical protein
MLAFMQKAATPPLLPVAHDDTGWRIEEWKEWRIAPWRPRRLWMPPNDLELRHLYNEMRRLFAKDREAGAAIERLIGFYVDAHSQPIPEMVVVNAVSGIERAATIAYDLFPDDISEPGEDKARLHVQAVTDWVKFAAPSGPLLGLANSRFSGDASWAVTEIRNAILHSRLSHSRRRPGTTLRLSDVTPGEIDAAGQYALLLLEMSILKILRYDSQPKEEATDKETAWGSDIS